LKAFPGEARRDAGFNLDFVQRGYEPQDWRPMTRIGIGVNEIRVRDQSGAFCVIYLAARREAVYVLHCFQKKTEKTNDRDIALAQKRFKAIPKIVRKWVMKKRTRNEHGRSHIVPVGRSVFYELGFDDAEARVLQIRADLIAALREHIATKEWTQIEAAKKLGTTQPRVSALMKGAWRDFSADTLLILAGRVGLRPTLKLVA
jgi:phage-related protein/predicted XRE-type DNA-binding protein